MKAIYTTTRRFSGAAWLVALVVCCAAATAEADSISYSLVLSEDLNVLKNPNNANVLKTASWQSQHTLLLKRSMPYMELKNTSQDALITQFNLTIGNTASNFDWASLVEASPGVSFSLQSPDAVAGALKSDLLIINFTGFEPGDFVRFRTGLSPDSPNVTQLIDYRQTFFHLNGMNLPGSNSMSTVNFHSSLGNTSLTKAVPNFSNDEETSLGLELFGYGEDTVIPYTLLDSGSQVPPPPVPEPGSFVLLAAGLFGLLGLRLCNRRR